MKQRRGFARLTGLLLCFGFAGAAVLAAAGRPRNLIANGGFEKGTTGWSWPARKGQTEPGFLNKETPYQGLVSYTLSLPGAAGGGYVYTGVPKIDPAKDYELSLVLRGKGLPKNSVSVELLQWGAARGEKPQPQGWVCLPSRPGVNELITAGGTFDWKKFAVRIPAQSIRSSTKWLVLFIRKNPLGRGKLGIDEVSMVAVDPILGGGKTPAGKRPKTGPGKRRASVTYTSENSALLVYDTDPKVAIRCEPDLCLYRTGKLPRITVESRVVPGGKLAWNVKDGFGKFVVREEQPADGNTREVKLPPGHGYYEIIVRIIKNGKSLAEARRSIGALPPPPKPDGDEPFGLWVQGDEYYPELGVRWTRSSLYYNLWRQIGDAYWAKRIAAWERLRAQGIRVIAFPKRMPDKYAVSPKILKDTPEAWHCLETFWTAMVKGLRGHVDAWAVINEPYRGMWKGSDQLIVRYWTLLRRIIDKYDPDTPLIGPSLNVIQPLMMAQYKDLLKIGFGGLVDGLELHTYTLHRMPEDVDWAASIAQVRRVTRRALGRDLPIYGTEMGVSADYSRELYQAQYTARSFLWTKKLGLKVNIWHGFSWPQAKGAYERNYHTFRNGATRLPSGKWGPKPPQPRPAAITYGTMTRQLAGARFRNELDYLGPNVKVFVFERDDGPMLAIWTTGRKERSVRLAVDVGAVTLTGMFGRAQKVKTDDGVLKLRVSGSPVYVAPVGAHLLKQKRMVSASASIEVLPGGEGGGELSIHNPTGQRAAMRVELIEEPGWEVALASTRWTLAPGETATTRVRLRCPENAPLGDRPLFGKVYVNERYAGPCSIPVLVQPRAEIVGVRPSLEWRLVPVLRGKIRRHDPSLPSVRISVAGSDWDPMRVEFRGVQDTEFALPAPYLRSDRLQAVGLRLSGAGRQGAVVTQTLSFVPAAKLKARLNIDGQLGDWSITESASQRQAPFSVRWAWDAKALYLAVRVTDKKHVQTQPPDQMWREDDIQIGIAPISPGQWVRPPASEMQESEFTELSLALCPDGPVLHRSRTVNRELAPLGLVAPEDAPRGVRHADGVTTYELRLPVRQVGLRPLSHEQVLRVSVLINRSDGAGRKYWEWFSGIYSQKTPDLYGHLILLDQLNRSCLEGVPDARRQEAEKDLP
ncbi:MAG: hypothetical protein GXP31_17795 [Kiritimatiellaeota bacterium]|nr:hypothetical protein [Kiritimatiellota bacterium]